MSDSRTSFPPNPPEPDIRKNLVKTLRTLERDPSGNDAARNQFRGWLSSPKHTAPDYHLELHELKDLVQKRQREGAAFQLPTHLLECRMCMELFQVLCQESAPDAGPIAPQHGRATDKPSPAKRVKTGKRRNPLFIPGIAAALLLGLLLWGYLRPPGIVLESGALRTESETLRDGALPARIPLQALRQTQLRFLDGSGITLEPGTRIHIGRTPGLHPVIEVTSGEARFDFRDARAAPQLRSGDLRILPANAEFELTANDGVHTITVLRGGLQIRHASETRSLNAGDRFAFP